MRSVDLLIESGFRLKKRINKDNPILFYSGVFMASKWLVDSITKMYKLRVPALKLTNISIINSIGKKLFGPEDISLTYIPINESVELPDSCTAPFSIIENFVKKASHHVIIKRCPCRTQNRCKNHNPNIGCLFLGEGGKTVNPKIGRHATLDDALEHIERAKDDGLLPMIGKFKGDAMLFGVKDADRLMTICNCCECCCVNTAMHFAAKNIRDFIVPLKGISIDFHADKCIGCGNCADICIFKQIEIINGKAVKKKECKLCGRCADACDRNAFTVHVTDTDYVELYSQEISKIVRVN